MGYSTHFDGQIGIEPPLNEKEVLFLNHFADSRRMERTKGPYCVEQRELTDVINANNPPEGQPGLWCQWVATDEGDAIEWDGNEKFYNGDKWMQYLIDHFIGENPLAKLNNPEEFGFLQGHKLNGEIFAAGDDQDDRWKIEVKDGTMNVKVGEVVYA